MMGKNNGNGKPPAGWEAATWEGSRRESMRRWAELPVERMLAVQEEMAELGDVFGVSRETGPSVAEPGGRYSAGGRAIHEVVLAGCQPTPLASYLKALGVLRLVAEQADPEVRGFWRDDQFVLAGALDRSGLRRFFLEAYRPTAVLAPWNGGSGFHPKDNRSGIAPIEQGTASRLAALRDAIGVIRDVLARLGVNGKPDGAAKTELLVYLRSELGDATLDWLDAAVVLTDENPKYPPLLGTGGNDGRLDFTNNFMQHLVELLDADTGNPKAGAERQIDEALFGEAIAGLEAAAVGQFSPGDAGGPNQGSGYTGSALVNSWDFVLMLEGALLFAAAATRRLDSASPAAPSYPFTVRPTGSGAGGTDVGDEGNARAEIWLPIWKLPAGLPELRALLSDGRVTLGKRAARDGLEFVRAVSRLGADRGIMAFQRYAFMMRSGKAYLATPLNRVTVRRNHAADLIDELDNGNWLTRFRRLGRSTHASNRIQSLVRRLEDALFELAQDPSNPGSRVQQILIVLGEAQRYLARSAAARAECPPVPSLSGNWLRQVQAGGETEELSFAAALASLHARRRDRDQAAAFALPMRMHLAPELTGRYPVWIEGETHQVTWGHGRLEQNLAAMLQRRLLQAQGEEFDDKPLHALRTAGMTTVAAWLNGGLDEQRIASLLPGLMLVRLPSGHGDRRRRVDPLPAAYRVLKPFFCTDRQLRRSGLLPSERRLPLPAGLVRRLAAGDVAAAVALGLRKRRAAGIAMPFSEIAADGIDGPHLLVALLTPVTDREIGRLEPGTHEHQNHAEPTP